MRILPSIDTKYWLTLMMASILGTNTGDFVAGYMHLGHLAGLPYLLVLFAAILAIEKLAPWKSAVYFWAAIITMRTAATNIGDAFHDFRIGYDVSIPAVLAIFVASALLYKRVTSNANANGTVRVNPAYWWCMMVAGILGTIGGDFASFSLRLTPPGAFILFSLLIVASIRWFGKRGTLLMTAPYWLTVALIRTGGTAGGDAVAHAIGLPASTALTGLVFVALVGYFYGFKATNAVMQPS